MNELVKRLEDYYHKQKISALNFSCPNYPSYKKGYNDFIKATGREIAVALAVLRSKQDNDNKKSSSKFLTKNIA